ncbi:MarR family transcriptional regulator [Streptacidiphilus sp. 4-A2]|nr:MarR family transcriptional regulator [Streptacidiphilus sp. 4-A2]
MPWREEVALLVGRRLRSCGCATPGGEALAGAAGQTQARWQLMSAVSEEPLPVARAARRLGVARQGVQRIANDLVRDGLAEFQDNPDHRTSPLLALTRSGQHALGAITAQAASAHRAMGAGIPERDLAAVRALLQRLTSQTDAWTESAATAQRRRATA